MSEETVKSSKLLVIPNMRTAMELFYCSIANRINSEAIPTLKILNLFEDEIVTRLVQSITSSNLMENFLSFLLAKYISKLESSDSRDICSAISIFQDLLEKNPIRNIIYPGVNTDILEVCNSVVVVNSKALTEESSIIVSEDCSERIKKAQEAIKQVNDIIGGKLSKNKIELLFSHVSGGFIRDPKSDKLFELANKL